MRGCESDVPSSSDDCRGVTDGSRGKFSPVASICRCVWELLYKNDSSDLVATGVLRT